MNMETYSIYCKDNGNRLKNPVLSCWRIAVIFAANFFHVKTIAITRKDVQPYQSLGV